MVNYFIIYKKRKNYPRYYLLYWKKNLLSPKTLNKLIELDLYKNLFPN